MSKRDREKGAESDLVAAAEALDGELRTFERLVDAVRRHPLSSQKHLERMANALTEAADSDKRMEAAVRALADAITAARGRQQAQAEVVHARALVLQQRTQDFVELQRSFEALGASASELTARMKEVATQLGAASGEAGKGGGAVSGLGELISKIGELAEGARSLAEAAKERDFTDIAQQADALRQQLASAKNRLSLAQKSAPGAS